MQPEEWTREEGLVVQAACEDAMTEKAKAAWEEAKSTLEERVNQFHLLQLPGQPMGMHMGTSYLVSDLWRRVKELEREVKDQLEGDAAIAEQDPRFLEQQRRIEELEALTKADGKEIGSYRKGTGLRGENKRLQKMLDEVEAEVQRLREEDQANGELYKELYKVLSQRMDSMEKHRDELFDENKRLREAIVSAPHEIRCPWPVLCNCWKSKALAIPPNPQTPTGE